MPTALPKIGLLAVSPAESIDALTSAMAEHGCVRGRDYELFMPPPTSVERGLAANMQAILAAGVALVIAQTKPAARVAIKATREVPLVLGAFNGDPAREGLVETLERPGGSVTGTYYRGDDGASQRFALLRELAPDVRKVGILMNPRSDFSRELASDATAIASAMALDAEAVGASDATAVEPALARARAEGFEAIVSVTGADIYTLREALARAAWLHRMPAVMGSIGFADLGGLAKLGPDIPALWRRMASAHVIPILTGASPAALPMVGAESFELEINLATAAHLGLAVPETLRRRATKLIHSGLRN